MTDSGCQHLGSYRLLRLLGRGGFASVYLGEHSYLRSPAALKVLHTHLSEEDAAQFLREAQTLARLSHPHIVRVLDFAVQDGTPFLVMEYAPGGTLRQRHPAGACLPVETVVSYVQQVASALQYAHDRRLIHRDVKPENLFLNERREVLLGDFGLAMLTPHTSSGNMQAREQPLTGTTPYLAPEQVHGKPQPASDQYALGVVVYEWLCGRHPFGGTPIEVAMQHLSAPPLPLRDLVPELSPAIEEVVLRALVKEPGQRFPSVQDFATALERACQEAVSPHARPVAFSVPTEHVQEQPSFEPHVPDKSTLYTALTAVRSPEGEGQRDTAQGTARPGPMWKMPTIFTPLVGREQDVEAVCALLSRPEVRLVTLVGTGGVGKTRLSIEVATRLRERFAAGVCFVELAPISDPDLVMPAIALGIQEKGALSIVERVKVVLREQQLLLILDSFEQVMTAAPQVVDLLTACPQLKVLVTSREVLHVQAEHLFPVSPLALPDLAHLPEREELAQCAAVSLFLQRAQATLPCFQMTSANARAIAEICARLDGLPLAIELAAARIKLLPPQALLERLGHRLQVLTSRAKHMPIRQQTLRNTIQWSYNLLNTEEQRLFRRLSVFVGGCTLEAVETICAALSDGDATIHVLDGVASLLDKSLLQQTEQEGEEPRLSMLETVREYGLETLTENGDLEAVRRAHTLYYLALAEQAEPELQGSQQVAWLERLEREHDNLRAAMQWSSERGEVGQNMEMALRLGGALRQFWRVRGHFSEGRTFLERALVGSAGVAGSARAKALLAAADVALNQGDFARGETLCKESLVLYRELEDRRGIAFSLRLLGWAVWNNGDPVTGRSLMEESLALRREVGHKYGVGESLSYLALLAANQGEYARGLVLAEEGVALFREIEDKRGIAWSLLILAETLFSSQGDQVTVRSLLKESLELCRELREKGCMAEAFGILGQVSLDQGDATTARALSEESLALYREIGDRWGIIQSLCLLAQVEVRQGDHVAARARYVEGLVLCKEAGDKRSTITYLEGLASVVAAQGEPAWAARLWGAAESLRTVMGAQPEQGGLFWMALPPVERASYERSVTAARVQLGKEAFAAAWAEGRTMTLEQALAAQGPATMPEEVPGVPQRATAAKRTPIYPAGLTAREVEILHLVAQGLSDAQVAEQLVISPRTVNWHLTSIYSKLGVSSRCAATRYAIEHKLV